MPVVAMGTSKADKKEPGQQGQTDSGRKYLKQRSPFASLLFSPDPSCVSSPWIPLLKEISSAGGGGGLACRTYNLQRVSAIMG